MAAIPSSRRICFLDQADALDAEAYEAALECATAPGLTGLVTCAGISLKEDFLSSTPEAWSRTLQVNLGGTVAATKIARSQGVW